MRNLLYGTIITCSLMLLARCTKKDCGCLPPVNPIDPGTSKKLSYGDSIFHLKNADYTIAPTGVRTGTYTAFPNNLKIDRTTGAITIGLKGTDGESQTGMWYKIVYSSPSGSETDSTYILLSGITYLDKFYMLAQGDSIVYPIYNGDPSKVVPTGDYDLAHDDKFAIDASSGKINLKDLMRRGFFGNQPATSWKIATVKYAINDNSKNVQNGIDVVIYYYHTMAEVPSNVSALMQAHQQMTLRITTPQIPSTAGSIDNNLPSQLSLSKPRPPCVIIIGS